MDMASGSVFWTRQVYAIYGVTEDFDVADPEKYLSFFTSEDQQLIRDTMQHCISHQEPYVFEAQANVGNHPKWVRVSGVPMTEGGQVVAIRGAVMDVTREKETALSLMQAKESAEQAARARTSNRGNAFMLPPWTIRRFDRVRLPCSPDKRSASGMRATPDAAVYR